jgi:hypothetical protein
VPQRDPQALTILQQCLALAGGPSGVGSIQDFTGVGTITYFWAGEPTTGSVTSRGLGASEFRLDAALPSGTRSWAVSSGEGTLKDADGSTTALPYADALTLSGYSFPFLSLAAVLTDTSYSVGNSAPTELTGRMAYQIQIQRTFSTQQDPNGSLGAQTRQTLFIDTSSLQLIRLDSFAHQNGRVSDEYVRTLRFSDYRAVNGVLAPFHLDETLSGQQTLSIQLDSVVFNSGLTDSIFQF